MRGYDSPSSLSFFSPFLTLLSSPFARLATFVTGFEIESWLTFIVAYSNLIPISLYVALEIVKLFQVVLIDSDLLMYHAETDTPTNARTSNLVEEVSISKSQSDELGILPALVMKPRAPRRHSQKQEALLKRRA